MEIGSIRATENFGEKSKPSTKTGSNIKLTKKTNR